VTAFAVSALGRDRPGIVAGVAQALLRHEANVEDSQMSILRGHFVMVLIVAAPEGLDAAELRRDLEQAGRALGLDAVSLAEVTATPHAGPPEPTHVVSVYGADHPGILHAVAAALAGGGINITDLTTRLVGEEAGEPLYVMLLEVAAGAGDPEAVLAPVVADQGVEVTVRPVDTATL
jgi:glycine cleavage system transcriptional repressor